MKVKLLKAARILHKPGDVVDVSQEVYTNLVALRAAVPESPKKKTRVKNEAADRSANA